MSVAENFKETFVDGLKRAMKKQKVSHSELARRMRTSRAVVYRLLQEDDVSLTLTTMSKAVRALGVEMTVRVG